MVRKAIEAAWLSAIVTVPLIVIPGSSNGFVVPKMLLLFACAAAVALLFVVCRKSEPTPVSRALLVFLVAYGVATIFSVDRTLSLLGAGHRGRGLLTIAALVTIAYAVTRVADGQQRERIIYATLIPAAWMSLWAIRTFAASPQRVDATIGNPLFFASYLLVPIFITAHFINRRGKWWWALYALYLVAFALTGSRAGAVGLAVGMLSWRDMKTAVTVAAIVIAAFSFAYQTQQRGIMSAKPRADRVAEAVSRATTIPPQRWLVGTGPETYSLSPFKDDDSAHNVYLQLLGTTGIIGLGAYLVLLLVGFLVSGEWPRFAIVAISVDAITGIMSISALLVLFTTLALADE